jgi:PAS domain S-box-containing protein
MASLGDYDTAGDHAVHRAPSTPSILPDPSASPGVDQLAARLAAAERRASAAEARAADAEAHLQRIHARHHALVHASGQWLWTASPNGHVVDELSTGRLFTGQSAEAVLDDGWADALHPDDRPRVFAAWANALANCAPFEATYRLRRADGAYRDILARGSPVRDAGGVVREWAGFCADITDRRRLEDRTFAALDALLATAQLLVSPDAVEVERAEAPPYTPAVAVGTRLAELTARVLGCDRVAILAAEQPGAALRPLAIWGVPPEQERLWRAGEPEGAYLRSALPPDRARRLNGGEVLVVDYTQPPFRDLPNPHGIRALLLAPMRLGEQLVGILNADFSGRVHDYTTEELRLAGAVAQLGALVVEREWLQRARAEAQASAFALREANQRMDAFLGIASHELRTPLTTIKANLQIAEQRVARMLTAGDTPPAVVTDRLAAVRSLIARASAATERQARLVRDLLDVSRIQAGRLTLHPTPTDLAALLRDAVNELRLSAPDRVITLTLPPGPVLVTADAERIGQVIANYLSNAIKYSRREQPVAVSLTCEAATARLAVRDHGPGIPLDEQPAIWDRFYRVPGAEHQYGSGIGLGLGLYIAREIVERHGGALALASTPGEGSTFTFTLPLAAIPPDAAEA